MNMREKIARAMYTTHPRNKPFDLLRPEFQAQYLKQADAVLDVIAEPTEEMVEAGRWPAEDDGPLACWRAMIQAAKEGK